MKRRLFTSVLSVLLLIAISIFGLAGCSSLFQTTQVTIALNETAKEIAVGESFMLTATTEPEDAEVVWSSSNEAIVTVKDGAVTGVSVGTATVTAKNDTATATCEITVKAAAQKYTVVFKNGDTQLKSVEVAAGASVLYNGAIPSKASTEQYTYVFSGWALSADGEVVDLSVFSVNENKTFYAVFVETVRSYNVTWNIDGETTSESVEYGAVPQYKGTTPTKPTVGNTSYTFIGWSDTISGEALESLPAVTGDATYYAVFDEVTAQTKFTVTWMDGETVLETDEEVEFEAVPTYNGELPTKEMTETSEYTFAGWATTVGGEKLEELPLVTADVTYYAYFAESARKYTITWVIEGEEYTSQCGYGSVPAYEGTPTKPDSEDNSWKFDGWALTEDGEKEETLPEVSGEAIYYAVFVVDKVFEVPKFMGGEIKYSANSKEIFLPDGLLGEGVTITSAKIKAEGVADVVAYESGEWVHDAITLTEEELKGNFVGIRTLDVRLSDGARYSVTMLVYAGIIDELSDFPVFFNNEAVPSEFNATDYPAVAPNVYGYYIVTKDLGTGSEELALTQAEATDYQKTNGFNGVLDGQGHTLRFKLTKGGLVGLVLGNAVIKNLAVIYEDATYTKNGDKWASGGYGVFGYVTNGAPEIRNCYIEKTNNHYLQSSVFGIMARPNNKLIIHNSVIYGFTTSNTSGLWGNMWIHNDSTNAYVIHARSNAMGWPNVTNFTKVFTDAIENGSREVLLSEIEDASGFDDNYWSKENGKLIWKGFETATITWVKGEETIIETATKGGWIMYTQTLPENTMSNTEFVTYHWSLTADGAAVSFDDRFQVKENAIYYMVENVTPRSYKVTWNIDGVETTEEYEYDAQIAHDDPVKEENDYYTYEFKGWALSPDGEVVELGKATQDGIVYYAVFESTAKISMITVNEPLMYSSADNQLFLPTELTIGIDDTVKITSRDGAVVYYENGAWANNFDLTAEQTQANEIATFEVAIEKGTDLYMATVRSYAGIIDELSDFPAFFNNDPTADTPDVYGYYIVTKNLGDGTDELTFTQSTTTTYKPSNGFNGVLDGAGHTLKFKLKKGGLLGMYLGHATIKNASFIYADETLSKAGTKWAEGDGGYGLFGFRVMGNTVLDNCYFERTNNDYEKASVFGLVARTSGKLVLTNTVIYGFNYNYSASYYGDTDIKISASSTNAYVVGGRSDDKVKVESFAMSANFTKVYTNGTGSASDLRGLPMADITDASGFNDCWNKETNLTWKGTADQEFSSVVTA